ncbi:hypothetical protein ACFX16_007593 [Malus domestica]
MQVHEFGLGTVSGGGGKERRLVVLGEGQWLVVVEYDDIRWWRDSGRGPWSAAVGEDRSWRWEMSVFGERRRRGMSG